MIKCPYCNSEFSPGTTVCQNCSFPAGQDRETRWQFLYRKSLVLKSEMDDALEMACKSKSILYFAALLMAIDAGIVFSRSNGATWPLVVGVLYVLIAITCTYLGWSIEKNPVRNAIIGLACSFAFIGSGLLGLASLLAMFVCMYYAIAYRRKLKQHASLLLKMDDLK